MDNSMATQHSEDYNSAPVQLETLLEVPVKFILIEDLIREKVALQNRDSFNNLSSVDLPPTDKESVECSDYTRTGSGKKCLFECCAKPSRWRETDIYSNSSQFRTAAIKFPWHDMVAVVPVMQVEKACANNNRRSNVDVNANEDTDTDVEMSNKNSDEDKDEEKRTTPDAVPLPLISPLKSQNNSKSNNADTDVCIDLSKESNNSSAINEHENTPPTNNPRTIELSSLVPSLTSVSASVISTTTQPATSAALLGKVTEKPTRYEDFITAHCSNTSSSNSNCNTITPRKEQHQQDVIRDTETTSQGSNSADDTLKLTFYNEGRKESTKEFRTTSAESGGALSGNDVRYFENQHGLQMSRVIREPVGVEGVVRFEGNSRIRQQPVIVESSDSKSKDNVCSSNDNTQNHSQNPNNTEDSEASSSNNNQSPVTSSMITQPQQHLRLTSSIIQNLSSNCSASNTSSSADNNDNTASQQENQWDGLQISRCQKEVNSVITLDEESSSNGGASNREMNSESSLATTTTNTIRNPPESDKGESENSIERDLRTYLTSLRYVKPTDNGNERGVSQDDDASGKSRPPVISSQSRHPSTSIISPVILPGNSCSLAGSVASVVRMPNIQRVSPSQQASSLDSWPERAIAKIPTRPFIRRNSTYELQQQQQQQQQRQYHTMQPPVPYPAGVQQQPRMMHAVAPVTTVSTPLQSPPKRFKAANQAINYESVPQHQQQQPQQQQQHYQGYPINRQANIHGPVQVAQYPNRTVPNVYPQNIPQQQQHHPASTNNTPRVQNIQVYNNLHHYNQQRPSSTIQHTGATSTVQPTQPPHYSPQSAQLHAQQQQQQQTQHQQYQMKQYANSNQQTPHHQQQHHQQSHIQFQRNLQQSLLIASTAVASAPEAQDKAYQERLRRYCEFYHKQDLDVTKLQEYYNKYGFYPWDILTARDESLMRQRRMQEQQQQQHHHQDQQQLLNADVIDGHGTSANTSRYDTVRRMDMDQVALQHQRPLAGRTMSIVNSPARAVPNFSPAAHQPVMAHGGQSGIAVGRTGSTTSPPIMSPQTSAQVRYAHTNQQQLHQQQQLQQHREYIAQQQQRINNRYYQAELQERQNYIHEHHHQQQQQQLRNLDNRGHVPAPTNYDVQSSPHYRTAYTQLAAAAAAVSSSVAGAASIVQVPQSQLRPTEVRTAALTPQVRDGRINQLLHSQTGVGSRPVVMTVSDPVPAPPDAVPLSIHRQALEQAIKHNQATTSIPPTNNDAYANRDNNCRRDIRRTPPPQHVNLQMAQQPRHGQLDPVGRARNEDSPAMMGNSTSNKEPLRVVPSPTLAHQTSVIRRIQQQGPPPPTVTSPILPGPTHHRYVSDRPGISYRRLSDGNNSTNPNSGEVSPSVPTAFLYQQPKDLSNNHGSTQYQQQHIQHLNNSSTVAAPIRRSFMPNENGQAGILRGVHKRRIIITDNNGINQNHTVERCPEVVSSPVPLVAGEEELMSVSPSAGQAALNEELPEDDDRTDSIGGAGWQYDHVVLLDKYLDQMLSDDEN